MTPVVTRLAERHRIERPLDVGALGVHAVAAFLACVIQAFVAAISTYAIGQSPAPLVGIFTYWLFTLLPAGVIVYAAVVGLRTSEVNRARLLARERQTRELATQLAQVQLEALRSQIQPHFLFNTLNAVIALVRDGENTRAVGALTRLSALLRTALKTHMVPEVSLGDDLAFTQSYLAIEQMRFGERLTVHIDVPEALRVARVPTFLLQPFVENAIRHGLRSRSANGRIDLVAHADDHRLTIRVEDDGSGLATDWEDRTASGFGVSTTRARLAHLYGNEASLSITPRPNGCGTAVVISLPLRRAS
jgi:two-component system, LytTR family, sensor kinase